MTEVNNFDIITPQLNFASNNRSIVLVWLVSRKKDGSTKVKGSNRVRTIKSYHFQSMEHFLEKREEIITICKTFHCRAYICMNPKPLLKTLFTLQEIVMDTIKGTLDNTVPVSLKGVLDSAIMKTSVKNGIIVLKIVEYFREPVYGRAGESTYPDSALVHPHDLAYLLIKPFFIAQDETHRRDKQLSFHRGLDSIA